jgi:hypothetical protein
VKPRESALSRPVAMRPASIALDGLMNTEIPF